MKSNVRCYKELTVEELGRENKIIARIEKEGIELSQLLFLVRYWMRDSDPLEDPSLQVAGSVLVELFPGWKVDQIEEYYPDFVEITYRLYKGGYLRSDLDISGRVFQLLTGRTLISYLISGSNPADYNENYEKLQEITGDELNWILQILNSFLSPSQYEIAVFDLCRASDCYIYTEEEHNLLNCAKINICGRESHDGYRDYEPRTPIAKTINHLVFNGEFIDS